MKKHIAFLFFVFATLFLSACASSPSQPRLSAGASHSVPLSIGTTTPGWLTNAVSFYPWSRGRKVRISTGVGIRPTPNTNAGIGIDW